MNNFFMNNFDVDVANKMKVKDFQNKKFPPETAG